MKRDRCFKPDKFEQALMEFFSLDWTELYVRTYELLKETLPMVIKCFGCMAYVLAPLLYVIHLRVDRAQPETTLERITLGEAKDRIARYEWITIRNV
jgi:hypothetical protein